MKQFSQLIHIPLLLTSVYRDLWITYPGDRWVRDEGAVWVLTFTSFRNCKNDSSEETDQLCKLETKIHMSLHEKSPSSNIFPLGSPSVPDVQNNNDNTGLARRGDAWQDHNSLLRSRQGLSSLMCRDSYWKSKIWDLGFPILTSCWHYSPFVEFTWYHPIPPNSIFYINRKIIPKYKWNHKTPWTTKSILRKEGQSWRHHTSCF